MRKLLFALMVGGFALSIGMGGAMAGGTSDTACDAGDGREFPGLFCFLVFECETGKVRPDGDPEVYRSLAMGCQLDTMEGVDAMEKWIDALFEKYVNQGDAQCDSPTVFGNFCPQP